MFVYQICRAYLTKPPGHLAVANTWLTSAQPGRWVPATVDQSQQRASRGAVRLRSALMEPVWQHRPRHAGALYTRSRLVEAVPSPHPLLPDRHGAASPCTENAVLSRLAINVWTANSYWARQSPGPAAPVSRGNADDGQRPFETAGVLGAGLLPDGIQELVVVPCSHFFQAQSPMPPSPGEGKRGQFQDPVKSNDKVQSTRDIGYHGRLLQILVPRRLC